jgi:hypothetical protein
MIVPDTIEPFTGFRVWAVAEGAGPHDLALESMYYPLRWPRKRAAVAECGNGGATPCREHACGLYAAAGLAALRPYLPARLWDYDSELPIFRATRLVVGKVHGWGSVAEHEDGWRAQYAYPAAIYVPFSFKAKHAPIYCGDAVALLAEAYGCQVRAVRRLSDLDAAA